MGGRTLFLKLLQKCGSRLWQVGEQEAKYISERQTQEERIAQIWENRQLFAASKASQLREQGRKLLLCSMKQDKKNTQRNNYCHSIAGQIPNPVFQQGNVIVEAQYSIGAVFIPYQLRPEHGRSKLQFYFYVSSRKHLL